ncbi:hypothetical protein IWA68_26265 [Bacillus albus]|nr:hypothetical protein [Bacillus albus]
MFKMKKPLISASLALGLLGVSFSPTYAQETQDGASNPVSSTTITPYMSLNALDVKPGLLANFQSISFTGNDDVQFNVNSLNFDIRYYIKNEGKNNLTWKITDAKGARWSGGTLAPGKSTTKLADYYNDVNNTGLYTLYVSTSNGGDGKYTFVARSLKP